MIEPDHNQQQPVNFCENKFSKIKLSNSNCTISQLNFLLLEKYSTKLPLTMKEKPKKFIFICLVDSVKSSSPMLYIFCWVFLVEMLRNELCHACVIDMSLIWLGRIAFLGVFVLTGRQNHVTYSCLFLNKHTNIWLICFMSLSNFPLIRRAHISSDSGIYFSMSLISLTDFWTLRRSFVYT